MIKVRTIFLNYCFCNLLIKLNSEINKVDLCFPASRLKTSNFHLKKKKC